MKLLFASKFYYRRAGLESYYFNAKDMLEQNGHKVIPFSTNYSGNIPSDFQESFTSYYELSHINPKRLAYNFIALKNMLYNSEAYEKVNKLCQEHHPDIFQGFGVTKHLSYSIFKAAKENGIPTVMRLSDYALLCPNSTGLDGKSQICKDFDCYSKLNFRSIRRNCVKKNTLASVIGFAEIKANKLLDGYRKYIDYFIAPSRFIRQIFIDHYGVSEDRIFYLPVFFDFSNYSVSKIDEDYIFYAGRLDHEKGLFTLLNALKRFPSLKLKMAGKGPLEDELKKYVIDNKLQVEFLGFQDFDNVQKLISSCSFLVLPSEWYENSPNIVLEAMAHGKAVIGSNIGGIPEEVLDGETGYLFEPKDIDGLADKIQLATENKKQLGMNGRKYLEDYFNKEKHYNMLMDIYKKIAG